MHIARLVYQGLILFWKLTRVSWQIMYGAFKIGRINPPIVSIFGGAHLHENDPLAVLAQQVSSRLVSKHISVITGGGSGIMRAASCIIPIAGKQASVLGIGVKSLKEERNECVEQFFLLDFLFARKWLMIHSASAFIVFPGGFGTLDELMEVVTLMYTKEILHRPIVLVGSSYWKSFITWMHTDALNAGFVEPWQLALITIADDLETIVCTVERSCKTVGN